MTTDGTQLKSIRLAHIAGVDHPAHQVEGYIVAKSMTDGDFFDQIEGQTMDLNEIKKSLEAPLNKDNAAEQVETLKKAMSYLVAEVEKGKAVEKAATATDTNEAEDDTNVTKTKADGENDDDGDEMTQKQKAEAWDAQQAKAKTKADGADAGSVLELSKALSTAPAFMEMQKRLDGYTARELLTNTEAIVKSTAGALQTDLSGFTKAIIAAGGADTPLGKEILKSIKASAEQLAIGGDLRKEIGANGVAISGDALAANAQFKELAKALSKKDGISLSKAFLEVAKGNPELVSTLNGGDN